MVQLFQVIGNVHNKMLGGNPVMKLYVNGLELSLWKFLSSLSIQTHVLDSCVTGRVSLT